MCVCVVCSIPSSISIRVRRARDLNTILAVSALMGFIRCVVFDALDDGFVRAYIPF